MYKQAVSTGLQWICVLKLAEKSLYVCLWCISQDKKTKNNKMNFKSLKIHKLLRSFEKEGLGIILVAFSLL